MHLGAMKSIVLWAFLLGTVRCGDYSERFKCAADPTNFTFTLKSYRNQTGHWQAQVQLDHPDVKEDVAAWNVDIDQSISRGCDGSGPVSVVATITVPPEGNAAVKPQSQTCIPEGNTVVRTQPKKRIPEGYTKFSEGHYFKNYTVQVMWLEARDACERDGAHLAIVNSETEARFIAAMWTSGSDLAFMGFNDIYQEGKYVTIFNQTLGEAGYEKWSGGEPNGGSSENCGAITRHMLLFTHWCNVRLPFFCELEF